MILPLLIARFGPLWGKVAFVACCVFAFLLILLGAYFIGRGDGKQGSFIEQQQREIEAQEKVEDANANASTARVQDAVRTQQQKDELDAVIQAEDDPDRQRILRGCAILRQQGRDTTHIPACPGSASRR